MVSAPIWSRFVSNNKHHARIPLDHDFLANSICIAALRLSLPPGRLLRCEATRSDAQRCDAMRSDAKRNDAERSRAGHAWVDLGHVWHARTFWPSLGWFRPFVGPLGSCLGTFRPCLGWFEPCLHMLDQAWGICKPEQIRNQGPRL